MKKHIVFFEAIGGTDKGEDGHRRDTMPMVNALSTHGWKGEVIQLSDEILRNESESKKIYEFVRDNADGYVSRVNPGNIKEEKLYFESTNGADRICYFKYSPETVPKAIF